MVTCYGKGSQIIKSAFEHPITSKLRAICVTGYEILSFIPGGSGKGDGSPSKAVIVGGVVGGLAVIALVVVIVVVFLRRRQNAKNNDNKSSKKM